MAQEVEPLFAPMVVEPGFHEAIKTVIGKDRAFCLRDDSDKLCGIIVISYDKMKLNDLLLQTVTGEKDMENAEKTAF